MTAPAHGAPGSFADRTVELIRRRTPPAGSVVVDLGCAAVALPEALFALDLGLGYVAVAPDQGAVERLAGRGIDAIPGDLSVPDAVFADVGAALAGRPVAAVVLSDDLSHVADAPALLAAVREFCAHAGDAPLVVHAPNVTHVDIATKLVMGRWDLDPAAPGSTAPARYFSEHSLTSLLCAHGFAQADAEDVERDVSAQHFPDDAVPLERTTPVGAQLQALRTMSGPGAFVEHFVRLYAPGTPAQPEGEAVAPPPFLSVLVRTQGKRWATLHETLLCLAAQTCDDFEVVVLLHDGAEGTPAETRAMAEEFHPSFSRRIRVVEVAGGGRCRPLNEGARIASGRYLAMVDDDDLVFAHWVESLADAAARAPGHVVRVGVATQQIAACPGTWAGQDGYDVVSRPHVDYPLEFDYVDHLRDNRTPNNGYAVPRSLVTDLGQGWDESLPVLEDWDHLLRAASICGVESAPTVSAMMRVWHNAENSKTAHPPEVWDATRRRILARHDATPLLLDCGSVSRLRSLALDAEAARTEFSAESARLSADVQRLSGGVDEARGELRVASDALEAALAARDAAEKRLRDLLSSRSWRVTMPLRLGARLVRRADALRRR